MTHDPLAVLTLACDNRFRRHDLQRRRDMGTEYGANGNRKRVAAPHSTRRQAETERQLWRRVLVRW
jgi:hypothetical protein